MLLYDGVPVYQSLHMLKSNNGVMNNLIREESQEEREKGGMKTGMRKKGGSICYYFSFNDVLSEMHVLGFNWSKKVRYRYPKI